MPVDLDKTRALLASVAGFTKGPWRIACTAGQGGIDSCKVYTDAIGEHPFCIGDVNHYRYVPADQKIFAAAPDLHRELTEAVGEIERLREELEKPVAGAWMNDFRPSERGYVMAAIKGYLGGWAAYHPNGGPAFASGPETGDAGRHAADLALIAAGYRLVGGVHPLPDEVRS